MKRMLPALVVFTLGMPARSAAHQLDEYLQAARIAFSRDQIVLEIDLTPGATIAKEIVAQVDGDGGGVVLPLEARAYGEMVIGDLELTVDDRPVRLALSAIEVPSAAEMHRGVGTIQLTATGAVDDVRAGTRRIRFSNRHHPAASVYLANALLSPDPDIIVIAQRRDPRQRQLEVEYQIASRWSLQLVWVLFGATLLVSRITARRA